MTGHWHEGWPCEACDDPKPGVTTYEEWRVTGTLVDEPYKFTWTPPHGHGYDPEGDARRFVAKMRLLAWTDGPHLHKRTVTVTDWEAVA